MRKLLTVAGAVLACLVAVLVVALVVLRVVGLDPKERRAGLWLSGEVVTTPVTDWSFTDTQQTVFVQTRAWYGLPHSVTTVCVARDGRLYLTSTYRRGMEFPRDRLWNTNVMRDPNVRLKIDGRLYDARLALVTDPAEKDAVLEAKAKKYPRLPAVDTRQVYVFRVLPG
jgi:hypothetical protein